MLVKRVAKSLGRRMKGIEGNVTCILADSLPVHSICIAETDVRVVLQKPITIIPANFYPLSLNVVVDT